MYNYKGVNCIRSHKNLVFMNLSTEFQNEWAKNHRSESTVETNPQLYMDNRWIILYIQLDIYISSEYVICYISNWIIHILCLYRIIYIIYNILDIIYKYQYSNCDILLCIIFYCIITL